MGKLISGLVIVAVIAACVFLLLPADSSQSAAPTIEKTIETVRDDAKKATPPKPVKKAVTDLPVPSETGPWPKVVAESVVHAFGRMQTEADRSHTFTLSNEGDADLELKTGNTTCKCTTFKLASTLLKPGESTQLEMQWHAGLTPDRAFRHGGDVHTNDPKRPVINYAVEGTIEMTFEVMPTNWSFGNLTLDQTGKTSGAIVTRLYDSFEITSIECSSGKIKVTPRVMTADEKQGDLSASGYKLDMELAADIPPGEFKDTVILHVSSQTDPIKIPLRARKFGRIQLQQMGGLMFDPNSLRVNLGSFSSAKGRDEVKIMLIVDQKDMTEEFQIVEKTVDPPVVKVELAPLGKPSGSVHRYTLSLSVPAGRPRIQRTDTNPGTITLKTNHPSGEIVSLGVLLNSN